MRQTKEFILTGLSRGNRCTIQTDHTDKNWFHASTILSPDRFEALFQYFKQGENAWERKPSVTVECDGFYDDGEPINPLVIDFKLP